MYLYKRIMTSSVFYSAFRISDNAWIPVDPDNTDYQNFNSYLTNNSISILDLSIINIIL